MSQHDCTTTDDPVEMEALATSYNKVLFEFEGTAGMEDIIDTVLVKVTKAMDAISCWSPIAMTKLKPISSICSPMKLCT